MSKSNNIVCHAAVAFVDKKAQMRYRTREIIEYLTVFVIIPGAIAVLLNFAGIDIKNAWNWAEYIMIGLFAALLVLFNLPRKKK